MCAVGAFGWIYDRELCLSKMSLRTPASTYTYNLLGLLSLKYTRNKLSITDMLGFCIAPLSYRHLKICDFTSKILF